MDKHTQGEWGLHQYYGEGTVDRVPPRDGGWEYLHIPIAAGDKIICEAKANTSTNGGWPHVTDWDECRANARLMIAAPRMLAALRAVLSRYAGDMSFADIDHIKATIKAATE